MVLWSRGGRRLQSQWEKKKKCVYLVQILNAAGLTERLAESAACALTSCQALTYLSLVGLLHSSFNQIHQLNHQAPCRSPLVISAKDFSLWLKPVLFRIICLFGWILVLNQMELAHISGRAHLLLALSCFSEYRAYLAVVAAPKSQVMYYRLKRSPWS